MALQGQDESDTTLHQPLFDGTAGYSTDQLRLCLSSIFYDRFELFQMVFLLQ